MQLVGILQDCLRRVLELFENLSVALAHDMLCVRLDSLAGLLLVFC
jgi:hypothetical protein